MTRRIAAREFTWHPKKVLLGWVLLLLSCGIVAYNWSCVAIYLTGRQDVPKFIHYIGAVPAAAGIGLGWTPIIHRLWWIPLLLDPAGAIYVVAFLAFLITRRGEGDTWPSR